MADDGATHRREVETQLDAVRKRLRLRGPRIAFRGLYRLLPERLEKGEQLVAVGDGSVERARGGESRGTYVVLTDRKVFGLDGGVRPLAREVITGVSRVEAPAGGAFLVSAEKRRDLLVRLADAHIADAMVSALQAPPPKSVTSTRSSRRVPRAKKARSPRGSG